MPRRNVLVLLAVTLVTLLCYPRVQKDPYARMLDEAMSTIEHRYAEPVRASELFQGAMSGMVGKLDENSAYVSPEKLPRFNEVVDQQFVGVGMDVTLDPQTSQLAVLRPLVGSPAYVAGVRAGDKILRIGPSSTQGMSLHDAASLLRGKPGDPVTLTILHQGEEKPLEITIVRATIPIPTVLGDLRNADGSWNYFLEGRDRIGYLHVTSFTDQTVDELRKALEWLTEHDMRGLVLDLRDNPGGYLAAAVNACRLFMEPGVIVTIRRRGGRISETYSADSKGPFTNFPMAVLVNDQTASAAEIVAASLQDHHRAVVVGQRSYGKGSVQEVISLPDDCGALKLTTASYWRPSGKNIQRPHDTEASAEWGVSPDEGCQVASTPAEQDRWRQWRAHRYVSQPAAKHGPAPNGARKPGDETLVDRPLLRAVDYVEKEAAGKP
jgi:carboxyl-terminal processing protease